jgi:hypothetical protein
MACHHSFAVMPGLVPGIHVYLTRKDVDGTQLEPARVAQYYAPEVGYTRLPVTSPAMTVYSVAGMRVSGM